METIKARRGTNAAPLNRLSPVIYGRGYSYGKVQSILVGAELKAREMNSKSDLSGIEHVALDEMFSQGRPVFGGIDLDTGYLFQLGVHESRGGEDWAKALSRLRDEQGLHPRTVVKDAGTGMAKGVKTCPHAHRGSRLRATAGREPPGSRRRKRRWRKRSMKTRERD